MLKNDRKHPYWMHGGLLVAALLAPWLPARADTQAADAAAATQSAVISAQAWQPMLLAAQYNGIHQHLDSFDAEYSGPLSFPAAGDDETRQTFGA